MVWVSLRRIFHYASPSDHSWKLNTERNSEWLICYKRSSASILNFALFLVFLHKFFFSLFRFCSNIPAAIYRTRIQNHKYTLNIACPYKHSTRIALDDVSGQHAQPALVEVAVSMCLVYYWRQHHRHHGQVINVHFIVPSLSTHDSGNKANLL